ncbi:hypothetical protein AHIS1_p034 [Acaryochloris phage A-HIS1]|nr:hypothetical protein AHIS1_p034 [Acaryochloris phage A-HIS1]
MKFLYTRSVHGRLDGIETVSRMVSLEDLSIVDQIVLRGVKIGCRRVFKTVVYEGISDGLFMRTEVYRSFERLS